MIANMCQRPTCSNKTTGKNVIMLYFWLIITLAQYFFFSLSKPWLVFSWHPHTHTHFFSVLPSAPSDMVLGEYTFFLINQEANPLFSCFAVDGCVVEGEDRLGELAEEDVGCIGEVGEFSRLKAASSSSRGSSSLCIESDVRCFRFENGFSFRSAIGRESLNIFPFFLQVKEKQCRK